MRLCHIYLLVKIVVEEGSFNIKLKKLKILTTGEKTSSKSTLYSCRNPFATILALYLRVMESVVCLRPWTQHHESALQFFGISTKFQAGECPVILRKFD